VIVNQNIVESVTAKLKAEVEKLKVGDGLQKGTDIGPIINKKCYEKIVEQINDAVQEGAEVVIGNEHTGDQNTDVYFVQPTVLQNVQYNMDIMHDETCVPVAPLSTFAT